MSLDVGKLRELAEKALREWACSANSYGELARGLISVLDALEAATERLGQYEEPGWINAVQKVQELKAALEAARNERNNYRRERDHIRKQRDDWKASRD